MDITKLIPWDNVVRGKSRTGWYAIYTELTMDEIKDASEWYLYKNVGKDDVIYNQSIIKIMPCDEDTYFHLYRRAYNPVKISIVCPTGAVFKTNDKGDLLYNMICSINSVDDSSYTIWFMQIPYKTLNYIRGELVKYIDELNYINGEELLKKCILLGADESTIDYN